MLDIPDVDGMLAAITSPSDRVLAESAARLGVGWGVGTGIDALALLGGRVLSELVAACHRLAAWASWCEGVAAACLARTPEMNRGAASWGPGGRPECLVTEEERRFTTGGEIACRLGLTRQGAGQVLDRGQALLQPDFAATETLHRAGLLDQSKTALIVRRLEEADPEVAVAVQERVLPRASRRTASQLGRDIDRALAALDPGGAGNRRKRNQARRQVTRPRQAGEGVHEMRLLLPSLDAFLLDTTLDAIAASARAAGDQRSLAQLRADAVTGMTLRTLQGIQYVACRVSHVTDAGIPGGAGPTNARGGVSSGGPKGDAESAAPAVLPASAPSAEVAGTTGEGHACADAACRFPVAGGERRLLPDGVPLEGLLGALNSLVEPSRPWWTPSGIEPVFPPSGITINVDVTVPLDHLLPDAAEFGGSPPATGEDEGPPPDTGASPPAASAGASEPYAALTCLRVSASEGPSAPAAGGGTLPTRGAPNKVPNAAAKAAEVTIGTSRVPVPAATARALAAGGTWRRLVTDPLSGAVLDVGRSHYRPPAALRDLVQTRDVSCTFPGCTVPASRCDIDHVQAWADGGTTSLTNLTVLCQAHHRLKHTPGWTLSRQDGGALVWTTPTGRRYRRDVDGTITLMAHRIGPRQLAVPVQRVPERLAQAVDDAFVNRLRHGLKLATASGRPGRPPWVTSRGPRPGQVVGAFESTPYPDALHDLGLAPLLDEIPPF
ncbi:HNH endonuclease signature motif containing protein [Actinomyces sp.]|uniref:HNH endonuclease signature motif containing protein n=1 Tax=Actinomyces sp. TaxID=29317 RepID=UPI0026DBDF37|nr:HNH endonuclease signature motif containing protein [Actinomyces sp.]MDO4899932.1 DUF222 domain-containing protein [Actinomyces sp.]